MFPDSGVDGRMRFHREGTTDNGCFVDNQNVHLADYQRQIFFIYHAGIDADYIGIAYYVIGVYLWWYQSLADVAYDVGTDFHYDVFSMLWRILFRFG